MSEPIRIVLADDQELVRAGLRMILEAPEDMEVVGEAADGAEAVERVRELAPHVVLMDIRMPVLDGIAATERIAAAGDTRVLVLTTFDADEYVYDALRAGASGFLLKDAPPERLLDGIRAVARNEALLAPSLTRRLIEDVTSRRRPDAEPPAAFEELTPRETEVLELVARGLSNSEIAEKLVISEATVKTHVGRLFMKLGLRDRAQAVVLAYESGLIVPGEAE